MTPLLLAVLAFMGVPTLVGLWQEYKRQRALDRLDRENRRKVKVTR